MSEESLWYVDKGKALYKGLVYILLIFLKKKVDVAGPNWFPLRIEKQESDRSDIGSTFRNRKPDQHFQELDQTGQSRWFLIRAIRFTHP